MSLELQLLYYYRNFLKKQIFIPYLSTKIYLLLWFFFLLKTSLNSSVRISMCQEFCMLKTLSIMSFYVTTCIEVQQINAENIFLLKSNRFKMQNAMPFSTSDMHAVLFLESLQVTYTPKDFTEAFSTSSSCSEDIVFMHFYTICNAGGMFNSIQDFKFCIILNLDSYMKCVMHKGKIKTTAPSLLKNTTTESFP